MTNNKSISINMKSHSELEKLAEILGMNYGNLVSEMIYYFKKTGIHPKDPINKNPSTMISSLDKRIVSFLKVQERDILKPLRQDVFNYQNLQKEEISTLRSSINKLLTNNTERSKKIESNYKELINKINIIDDTRSKKMNIELEKNRQAILILCKLIDDNNKSGTLSKIKTLFT